MSLVCLSFSHQNTPIEFRERIYFDSDSIANACARYRCGGETPSQFTELAILSTCNRTEFYAYSCDDYPSPESPLVEELFEFIATARDVDSDELKEFGRWVFGAEVAHHLCRVASGLESLVLGEPQILGQVGDSMRLGLAMNSAGAVLTRMFQTAIRSGRRARTETQINTHSLNVSTVAVNTAQREIGNLADSNVVLLGAGEMADLALDQLRQRGAQKVRVVNRTLERAEQLSKKHQGQAFVFEQITNVLSDADILICSTGAPHTLITPPMISMAMSRRPDRKMFILDIAVPRDVDPEVEKIENVFRCDVDDLHISTGLAAEMRQEQIPHVERIASEELNSFLKWLRSVGVDSIVAGLHKKANEIRVAELARLKSLLADPAEQEWETIERFAKSLVNKLLHDPVVQLRSNHGAPGAIDHAEAVRELFQLELPDAPPANLPMPPSNLSANKAPRG